MQRNVVIVAVVGSATWTAFVFAQTATPPALTGSPPPEGSALVTAPSAPDEAPKLDKPVDGTTGTVSAGGQAATGNSKLVAGTINGTVDHRRGAHGFGASLLGNYGEGAPAGQPVQRTTENVQGRIRYDLYFIDEASAFAIATGRHDYFEGIDFRLNLDPGVKYLLLNGRARALWVEAGYDFQYQINNDGARVLVDKSGKPVTLPGLPPLYALDKTQSDHAARLFFGYRHAFNKEVTLGAGVEYLQSVLQATRYRVNFDALFAAKVGGGFSVGLGFSARFDHDPLPNKDDLDTATTVSLIYAFSDLPQPAATQCPVCTPPPAPSSARPASAAAPSPTAAPSSAPQPDTVLPPPSPLR